MYYCQFITIDMCQVKLELKIFKTTIVCRYRKNKKG